ncbi:MAG TPA: xanthine dehydrogenase accessory protein XdhC [Bacteriovoracaceae bacterium]|nr:xanthine dehydrogenase accessory protein XdhC [Bacteriovoracaceae bacterium]
MEQNFSVFCEEFLKLSESNTPMVVVTQTHMRGSAPQDIGARMIVGLDGIIFGTIGGGKIEKRCIDTAHEFLTSKEPVPSQSFTWNLQKDIGMTCGGEVTIFFEIHRPQQRWSIAIFGAGHISQELTRVLLKLDCELTVIDQRQEWLDKLPPTSSRFKKICQTNMAEVIDSLKDNTFVASVTMGHATDTPIIFRALSTRNFPYLGVIGSYAKRNRIESELKELGIAQDRLKDFFCPMGEDFGRNAPVEIALSITAQMLKLRDHLFQMS